MGCPVPLNEKERLEALYQLQILDTSPEIAFDEITKLAAQICGCKYSLISLIDHDRQWFKSNYNFPATHTPREETLCAYTILESEFLLVPNAKAYPRFNNLPPVKGSPFIHFYAAAPIVFDQGLNLGAVCVFDSEPRVLNTFQIEALKGLSRLAANLLEGRKALVHLQNLSRTAIETEKKMARAEQIKELAEMTGGLVHEINTPLTVFKLSLESLKNSVSFDNPKILEQFNRLEKATDRIQSLTQGLLNYARDSQKDLPTRNHLKNIISDTLTFSHHRLRKNDVQLSVDHFDDNLMLHCNPVEISQVLLNLVNNSCDAVANLSERWIHVSIIDIDETIKVSVTDSGSGLPLEIQSQIFQPFYTTKRRNYGTGLGLSICRRIIERHNGTIEINPKNKNTQFILTLPKIENFTVA